MTFEEQPSHFAIETNRVNPCPFCGTVPKLQSDKIVENGTITWQRWYLIHSCPFFRGKRVLSPEFENVGDAIRLWNSKTEMEKES